MKNLTRFETIDGYVYELIKLKENKYQIVRFAVSKIPLKGFNSYDNLTLKEGKFYMRRLHTIFGKEFKLKGGERNATN